MKISQETLAETVGTMRSRVSQFMNKFRKLSFIDYNGQLEVHSTLLNILLREQAARAALPYDFLNVQKRTARVCVTP